MKRTRIPATVLCLGLVLAWGGPFARAESLQRRDGRTIEGVILSVSRESLLVEVNGMRVNLPRKDFIAPDLSALLDQADDDRKDGSNAD